MRSLKQSVVFNNQTFSSNQEWLLKNETINLERSLEESHRATVYVDDRHFYKLIKTRGYFRSACRLLTGRSKTKHEIFGNQKLRELNLLVPDLKFHGVNVLAKHHNEILVFEKLSEFKTVKEAILNNSEPHYIFELLLKVAEQLNVLIENNVFFHDFHFSNVMVNAEGTLYWVDTSATIIEDKQILEQRIKRKLHTFRFQKDWLEDCYWNYFKNNIKIAN